MKNLGFQFQAGQWIVCIDDSNQSYNPKVVKGEIYQCERHSIEDPNYIFISGFDGRDENGLRVGFKKTLFRPVDDTFGEVMAEIIEKQVVLEDMETLSV